MADRTLELIGSLVPRQFENLTYECLRAVGMKNLVWRTPGSDGGRDIEGLYYVTDIAGQDEPRKWFVECKRYKRSVDWPTVWVKIAYAESNGADVLLVSTNSNPSPQCENEIAKWNAAKRRPIVRFWRGYDLANIVRTVPHVAAMFGLIEDEWEREASLLPLAQLVSKTAHSAYTRAYFSAGDQKPVETTASLSELFLERLRDLREYGRPVRGPRVTTRKIFDWLTVAEDMTEWEDTSLRAALSFLTYEFHAKSANLAPNDGYLIATLFETRDDVGEGMPDDREIVCFWSGISIQKTDDINTWKLEMRDYV